MSLIIYNDTDTDRGYYVWTNDNETKHNTETISKGVVKARQVARVELSQSVVQVVLPTTDLKVGSTETDRGWLVTDIATSGAKAWVYLSGRAPAVGVGTWTFLAGGGVKYRVNDKGNSATYQWTDASKTTNVGIKGRNDGSENRGDEWPLDAKISPVDGQPPVPVAPVDPGLDGPPILIDNTSPTRFKGKHVIAGRNGTVYLIKQGKLYRYQHQDFANGSKSWAAPVELGSGWGGTDLAVLASNEGVLYRVTSDGKLIWYQDEGHAGGGGGLGNDGQGRVIGTGWNQFLRVMAADDGVLYAVTNTGDLMWYRHESHAWIAETGMPGWRLGGGGLKVGDGWHDFAWSGVSSAGVVYAISADGTLRQFTHWGQAEGTESWSQAAIVGQGWNMFTVVTVSNDGVFYGVHASGILSWYRHDGLVDATDRWRSVLEAGTGWDP